MYHNYLLENVLFADRYFFYRGRHILAAIEPRLPNTQHYTQNDKMGCANFTSITINTPWLADYFHIDKFKPIPILIKGINVSWISCHGPIWMPQQRCLTSYTYHIKHIPLWIKSLNFNSIIIPFIGIYIGIRIGYISIAD